VVCCVLLMIYWRGINCDAIACSFRAPNSLPNSRAVGTIMVEKLTSVFVLLDSLGDFNCRTRLEESVDVR
jgi:hypothetical protein